MKILFACIVLFMHTHAATEGVYYSKKDDMYIVLSKSGQADLLVKRKSGCYLQVQLKGYQQTDKHITMKTKEGNALVLQYTQLPNGDLNVMDVINGKHSTPYVLSKVKGDEEIMICQ